MNNTTNLKLPSNKKFGVFFSIIFFVITIYCLLYKSPLSAVIFGNIFFILIFITLLSPNLLTPLNKLWMQIGHFIGTIVSPLVMGIIYFLFFAPLAIVFKIIKRDYLKLKFNTSDSYWIERVHKVVDPESFKNQF